MFDLLKPVIVMNFILLIITILLLLADKLLINYGKCKITVKKGEEIKTITVVGGNSLLADLRDNGINVSNSCGGKGSCGYCKVQVLEGGGPLLPTESIFMSRSEKIDKMRLACQVKVKNDLEIQIPDHLAVVREMVLSKNFNSDKRWLVRIK